MCVCASLFSGSVICCSSIRYPGGGIQYFLPLFPPNPSKCITGIVASFSQTPKPLNLGTADPTNPNREPIHRLTTQLASFPPSFHRYRTAWVVSHTYRRGNECTTNYHISPTTKRIMQRGTASYLECTTSHHSFSTGLVDHADLKCPFPAHISNLKVYPRMLQS